MRKILSRIINALLLPLRLLASHDLLRRLRLRSMRDERVDTVLRYCKGKVLDIGCGESNPLVNGYAGPGVGVDVHPWPGVNILCDTRHLPFEDGSFETVVMLAVLNHIPDREAVLRDCHRVLVPGGQLLVTMLGPAIGKLRHRLAWWDRDQRERQHAAGELMGLDVASVEQLLNRSGFQLRRRVRFVCGLNRLYIAERGAEAGEEPTS